MIYTTSSALLLASIAVGVLIAQFYLPNIVKTKQTRSRSLVKPLRLILSTILLYCYTPYAWVSTNKTADEIVSSSFGFDSAASCLVIWAIVWHIAEHMAHLGEQIRDWLSKKS